MAQRTAAERFLAALAKTASAGLCLALAAAVLLLAGCGGSSGDSGSTSTASSTASSASAGSPASPSSPSANSPSDPKAEQDKGAGHSSGAGAKGGGEGKHGTPVTLPKDQSGREHAPTAAEKANSTIADMTLFSPSLPVGEGIAALSPPYTCDGAGSWPALRWSGVPAGTKELVLYVMNAKPVDGRLFFDWAVAGIDPSIESLEAGGLPKGAVVGTNSFGKRGYEICPELGGAETYLFALFALPKALSPAPGFDPRPLREEILATSGNVGLLSAIYARG